MRLPSDRWIDRFLEWLQAQQFAPAGTREGALAVTRGQDRRATSRAMEISWVTRQQTSRAPRGSRRAGRRPAAAVSWKPRPGPQQPRCSQAVEVAELGKPPGDRVLPLRLTQGFTLETFRSDST